MSVHLLDRPVWSALTTRWASLALGKRPALRLAPEYGLFAATADDSPDALAALADLVAPRGETWLVEMHEPPPPPRVNVTRRVELFQMIAPSLTRAAVAPVPFVELGDADAAEMIMLAMLTKPGPFLLRTHRFGGFIGVRDSGRLVAMAGTRMRLPGYCEVSGVCTHPDYRGRGYAGALMRVVCQRILDAGETPILHTYAANKGANTLYESLGFTVRTPVTLTVLTKG
ncbi:MAG TPA: GNAT family N-acetyltransferase [Myxococcota bacterium]|nr:GNAT family N-acetyltransferase [Myxococcota bacterium]